MIEEYLIEMTSDEYGSEYFRYSSIEDAKDGMDRLEQRAKEQARVDGVTRTLNLIVEQREVHPEVHKR